MSADDAEADASNGAEQDGSEPGRFRLGDGIVVEYQAIKGGQIRLTFSAGGGTNDMREICTQDVEPDFYAERTPRGTVRNELLRSVPDDVSENVVKGGFDQLCRIFEEADVVEDEDLRSPTVNQLLGETEAVEVHAGDDSAQFIVTLSRGGSTTTLEFDQSQWASDDCGSSVREQYLVAFNELIEVSEEEWRTLRDVWHEQPDRIVRDESSDDDETIHDLIRRLKNRVSVIEEYGKLRNDTKNALYDRDNSLNGGDSTIQEEYGDADVLWIQPAVITELLDEIPGASPENKSNLASTMIRDGTLLRSRRQFGNDNHPAWAFDAEQFGGRVLLGEGDEDDESDGEDDDREVSI